ncbi:MAG: DUF3164 family protein [Bacteroidales bacterium]
MTQEEKQELSELLSINDDMLTEEQEDRLSELLDIKRKAREQKKREERETYKDLVDETVKECFPILERASAELARCKREIYDRFERVVNLKRDIYGYKENQKSDTFSTIDGSKTITLGTHKTDSYDDTVSAGEAMIKEWLESNATDEKSEQLIGFINDLLSKNIKGDFKIDGVLKLQKRAVQMGDEKLIDALEVIVQAYNPRDSKLYIKAKKRGNNGEPINVPLGMTEA